MYIILPYFCMEKHCFIKMGKDTVDHSNKDQYIMLGRIIKQDTRTVGLKKDLGAGKKGRVETWNAFLLRFQNINLSNKPLDSFQSSHLTIG